MPFFPRWGSDKIHWKLEGLYSPCKHNVLDWHIKCIHSSTLFLLLFFANPSDCRQKAILVLDQNVRQVWAPVLLLEGMCSVLGWAACCSGAGAVVVYLQRLLCVPARAGGLRGVCRYFPVTTQKVVLSGIKCQKGWVSPVLCSHTSAASSVWPSSEK